jgi:RHS repeat-associated protein
VTWIVTNPAGTNNYTATRFGYGMNDRTLSFAVGESWTWDGNAANCPQGYNITWAREFRYDGARARYLNRQLDPVALMAGNFVSLEDTWTDYDGDTAYGDYTVSGSTVTNQRSYEPGMAIVEPWTNTGPNSTDYFVTDHLGTTRGLTLPSGSPTDAVTFTAFGEKVAGFDHRYGYVGAHGYQAHAEMPFLHIGHRYYDPASGRFLQRDPIGISGGLNVYEYVNSSPLSSIDPYGLFSWIDWGLRQGKKLGDKIVQILTGHKPPPISAPLLTSVSALKCGPDVVRIKIAVDHRRTTLLEDNGDDINDAMDKYEKTHDQRVKPGKGPAG